MNANSDNFKQPVVIHDLEICKSYALQFEREDVNRLQLQNMNALLASLGTLTRFTGREMSVDYYSKVFFENCILRAYGSGLAIPSLGDQHRVMTPSMTGEEYTTARKNKSDQELLFVPILHMHTHPSPAEPSASDLRRAYSNRRSTYLIKENEFHVEGPAINLITGITNDAFFYKYTGNKDAYEQFIVSYDEKMDIQATEKLMTETGAFKSMYVKEMNHSLKGESLENFVNTFCPSTFTIRYLGPREYMQKAINTEK